MRRYQLIAAFVAASVSPAVAQQHSSQVDLTRVDAAIKSAFPAFPAPPEV
jgi:hypothetical protein